MHGHVQQSPKRNCHMVLDHSGNGPARMSLEAIISSNACCSELLFLADQALVLSFLHRVLFASLRRLGCIYPTCKMIWSLQAALGQTRTCENEESELENELRTLNPSPIPHP